MAAVAALACASTSAGSTPPPVASGGRPVARFVGCSTREPVCVHTGGTSQPSIESVHVALSRAEATLEFLRRSGLPSWASDGSVGGGPELDLYLEAGDRAGRAYVEPRTSVEAMDSASSYVVVDPERDPCRLGSDVARGVAQAALMSLAPASHPSTVALGSSQIAAIVAPCPMVEHLAVDAFQRAPEQGLTSASLTAFHSGHLWLDYLEENHGRSDWPRLWTQLVALTGQRTPSAQGAPTAEPDVFDILRRVFHGLGSNLDDGLLGFAVARAFIGSRSDGAHLSDTEKYENFGRVRFDWSVNLGSLPRRLQTRALEPTGASYVWLDTTTATAADSLTASIECEATYAFKWALVTVDAEGKELGRHVGGRWGESTTQLTLATLEGVASVLVVGVAAGHDDREHPFDPDEGSGGEAACEVTLHRATPTR